METVKSKVSEFLVIFEEILEKATEKEFQGTYKFYHIFSSKFVRNKNSFSKLIFFQETYYLEFQLGLLNMKMSADTSLVKSFSRNLAEIESFKYKFDRKERDIDALKKCRI